jgi:molecular chaperone DnaK (HSP70)
MNFIGIDFGTHYCTVSLIDSRVSEGNCTVSLIKTNSRVSEENSTVTTADSQILEYNLPSVIHIGEQILIGEDAVNLNNISYFKRLLCLKENEKHLFNFDFYKKNETIYIKTVKGDLSITQIIGLFFSKLKTKIENKINNNTYSCILTVPAYFNENQRKVIWDAVKLSSLPCIQLLNEPISACIAYFDKYNNNDYNNKNILVFDFGAGTLDLSIVRMEDEICEVLGIFGNNNLGGLDINYVLMNELNVTFEQAENQKKVKKYNKIYNKHFKNAIITAIDQVIQISGNVEIDNVILVGGSSKLVWVQELIKKHLNKDIINIHNSNYDYKDIAVSLGAAIHQNKHKEQSIILVDRLALSIGVKTVDNTFTPIIPRNSIIPISATKVFTSSDKQIIIDIYQGESSIINENIHIKSFEFKNIKSDNPVIYITIKVNINGIVEVIAKERFNDTETKIEINNLKDIVSDFDINNILNNIDYYHNSNLKNI